MNINTFSIWVECIIEALHRKALIHVGKQLHLETGHGGPL